VLYLPLFRGARGREPELPFRGLQRPGQAIRLACFLLVNAVPQVGESRLGLWVFLFVQEFLASLAVSKKNGSSH
jgi:hypothetical protein